MKNEHDINVNIKHQKSISFFGSFFLREAIRKMCKYKAVFMVMNWNNSEPFIRYKHVECVDVSDADACAHASYTSNKQNSNSKNLVFGPERSEKCMEFKI